MNGELWFSQNFTYRRIRASCLLRCGAAIWLTVGNQYVRMGMIYLEIYRIVQISFIFGLWACRLFSQTGAAYSAVLHSTSAATHFLDGIVSCTDFGWGYLCPFFWEVPSIPAWVFEISSAVNLPHFFQGLCQGTIAVSLIFNFLHFWESLYR